MVARQRDDILQDQIFEPVVKFLADFGIPYHGIDAYDEAEVVRAIHRRGWETEFTEEFDRHGWKAEIREWRHLTQSRSAIGRDSGRMAALLRALRLALSWTTLEQEIRSFNEQSQTLLGMSAETFVQRLYNNELDTDDPRVVHLLISRPLGW